LGIAIYIKVHPNSCNEYEREMAGKVSVAEAQLAHTIKEIKGAE
jgi:hypothetical protein